MKGIALISLAVLAASTMGARADKVDDFVRAKMKLGHIPGMAVAVVRNGRVEKLEGYGVANLEWNRPFTSETSGQLASATKPLVSTVLMRLVEEGKLELNAPVSKYLPDAPEAWAKVTIRHLASHTSGMKQFDLPGNPTSAAEATKIAATLPLEAPTGEKAAYGIIGYGVLTHIMEKVSGLKFTALMRDRLFKPLGMTHSGYEFMVDVDGARKAEVIPCRADVYSWDDGRQRKSVFLYPEWTYASGGLYTSAADMAKWAMALDKGALILETSQREMWTPTKLNGGSTGEFGLGWAVGTHNGRKWVGHSGGPALGDIVRFPDEKLTVVVLINQRRQMPVLAMELADLLLPPKREATATALH